MRFSVSVLALSLAVGGEFGAQAAPLGNAQCALARLKTTANMQAASTAVDSMAALAVNANDAAMAEAVNTAQNGLKDAAGAFQGIASAIGNKVAAKGAGAGLGAKGLQGLAAAKTALDNLKAAKGGAAAGPLAKAKAKITEALANGKQAAQCGDAAAADAGAAQVTGTATASVSVDATATATGTAVAATATAKNGAVQNENAENQNANQENPANNENADAADTEVTNEQTAPATNQQKKPQTTGGKTAPATKDNEKRQVLKAIGGIGCNVARFQTVGNLAKSSASVKKIASAAGADTATAEAAGTAGQGLNSAKAAIGVIAANIVQGKVADPKFRDQVREGLTKAQTALAGITSTDPAVTSALSEATANLEKTAAAGEQVVAKC